MAGLFFGAFAVRVVVFIDYQNLYHRARDSFFERDGPPPPIGHIHPLKVGELLVELGRPIFPDRELAGVNRGALRINNRHLWNHYLDLSHFNRVRDDTDYLDSP